MRAVSLSLTSVTDAMIVLVGEVTKEASDLAKGLAAPGVEPSPKPATGTLTN
jgi:hypothetical protein